MGASLSRRRPCCSEFCLKKKPKQQVRQIRDFFQDFESFADQHSLNQRPNEFATWPPAEPQHGYVWQTTHLHASKYDQKNARPNKK